MISQAAGAESQSSIRWIASQVTLAASRSCRPRDHPRLEVAPQVGELVAAAGHHHAGTPGSPRSPGPAPGTRSCSATPSSTAPQRKPEKQ